MARYALGFTSKTMVATADAASMTDNGYCTFLQGGGASMQLRVNEVYLGGESTSSAPTTVAVGRDSQVAATGISGNFNALTDAGSTAPGTVAVYGSVSTTKPQRSSTLGRLLGLSLNAFGGIARWQARYGEEITTVGASASLGELSVSSVTGTGILSGHVLYEVV
jgi:hypothetical protein